MNIGYADLSKKINDILAKFNVIPAKAGSGKIKCLDPHLHGDDEQ